MKKLISALIICTGVLTMNQVIAQEPSYKVIFENNSGDSKSWDALLNNVENASKALKKVEIEVVSHGEGLTLLTTKTSKEAERMKKLDLSGVKFMACENTMHKKHITKDQLLSFSRPVDSGVAEVIRKQQEGWSYIKSGD